jgi:Helix-turn-helix domain
MTKQLSQNERIRRKLARDGYVTRNQCLRQFPAITRLGARIKDLEKEGYVFHAAWDHGDYKYTVLRWPDGSVRPRTQTAAIARAHKMVELFDAGAPAEAILST